MLSNTDNTKYNKPCNPFVTIKDTTATFSNSGSYFQIHFHVIFIRFKYSY